jgi:hypothetical protein
MALVTSRARLLTAPGLAVDNPAASWGRTLEREIAFAQDDLPEAPVTSCGQEKVADGVS